MSIVITNVPAVAVDGIEDFIRDPARRGGVTARGGTLGGVDYSCDYRVDGCLGEATITQIFERNSQIQPLVIARGLTG